MPHNHEVSRERPSGVPSDLESAQLAIEKEIQPRDDLCGLDLPIGNGLWTPQYANECQPRLVKPIVHGMDADEVRQRDEAYARHDDDDDRENSFEQGQSPNKASSSRLTARA